MMLNAWRANTEMIAEPITVDLIVSDCSCLGKDCRLWFVLVWCQQLMPPRELIRH